jgi:hypothetical protein
MILSDPRLHELTELMGLTQQLLRETSRGHQQRNHPTAPFPQTGGNSFRSSSQRGNSPQEFGTATPEGGCQGTASPIQLQRQPRQAPHIIGPVRRHRGHPGIDGVFLIQPQSAGQPADQQVEPTQAYRQFRRQSDEEVTTPDVGQLVFQDKTYCLADQ